MKEQELKEQFRKWEQSHPAPALDSNHATRFLIQLKKIKRKNNQRRLYQWAAVALLCIGLGGGFQLYQEQNSEEVIQFHKAEFHLMQLIEEQMNTIENTNSPVKQHIIERSKNKLQLIQNNYKEIYKKWEANPAQPQLIQALISNLNTQINLLNEINTSLITIKNTKYEDLKI